MAHRTEKSVAKSICCNEFAACLKLNGTIPENSELLLVVDVLDSQNSSLAVASVAAGLHIV